MRSTAKLCGTFAVVVMLGTIGNVCMAIEEAKESAKLAQASGEIASVDALGGVLTLKESAKPDPAVAPKPISFLVDAKTIVSKDQQSLKLTDLRVGDQVTIEYSTKDGNNIVSSIAIQSPTGANSEQTAIVPAAKSSATSSTH